jgi:hypothetical protein
MGISIACSDPPPLIGCDDTPFVIEENVRENRPLPKGTKRFEVIVVTSSPAFPTSENTVQVITSTSAFAPVLERTSIMATQIDDTTWSFVVDNLEDGHRYQIVLDFVGKECGDPIQPSALVLEVEGC